MTRPALMYGTETWTLDKAHGNKWEAAGLRMIRWMCGVTKVIRCEAGQAKKRNNKGDSESEEIAKQNYRKGG